MIPKETLELAIRALETAKYTEWEVLNVILDSVINMLKWVTKQNSLAGKIWWRMGIKWNKKSDF